MAVPKVRYPNRIIGYEKIKNNATTHHTTRLDNNILFFITLSDGTIILSSHYLLSHIRILTKRTNSSQSTERTTSQTKSQIALEFLS